MMRLKFIFVIFFFIVSAQTVFAKDTQISGKIFDSNNNPVSQGAVVFTDASGKTIAAATSDMAGYYKIAVPTGTYTISVDGPQGAGLEKITLPNNKISSATILDFTLTAPTSPIAKKSLLPSFIPFIIGIFVLLVGIGVFIVWRKKRVASLSQPRSSD